ncbi:MAG: hypothetical protein PHQ65_09740 [Bacteroidales bacterium]|nr:hypothetical protein [Bacteroidales bacterium]MDD3665532.1 hypothetical protein [Bacteroidales bacterium]
MTARYYTNKSELYALVGEKIAFINTSLLANDKNPTQEELPLLIEAIDFLKDHKYQFSDQGLNQMEFIIRSAEEKIKPLIR